MINTHNILTTFNFCDIPSMSSQCWSEGQNSVLCGQ